MDDLIEMPERSLTEKQAAFVREYVENGGNASAAAAFAGYSAAMVKHATGEILALPHVRAAVREEQLRRIGGEGATVAIGTLIEIAQDKAASAGARVQASKALLDRALGAVVAGVALPSDDALGRLSAGEIAKLAGELRDAAGQIADQAGGAAAVVDLAPVAPDVAPGSAAPKLRKR